MQLIGQSLIGRLRITSQNLNNLSRSGSVLFNGPLSEMKDAQKAGLVINWIGHQCTMMLYFYGHYIGQAQNSLQQPRNYF